MATAHTGKLRDLGKETAIVSLAYLGAFFATFEVLMPMQNSLFPGFDSRASLLFLPHGVRVLAAWLLGGRSVPALLPGVVFVFFYLVGCSAFSPSRLAAIAGAVTVPAACFFVLRLLGHDLRPSPERRACWLCIMGIGLVISLVTSLVTNYAFDSAPQDYIAYLIGDMFGLFFLMLVLMLIFRALRQSNLSTPPS